VVQRVERLLEAGRRLAVGRAGERLRARPGERGGRAVPHAARVIVRADHRGVRVGVDRLERLGRAPVQEPAAGREQRALGDLADALVGELQPLVDDPQDAAPHQLLDALGGLRLVEAGRALQEHELDAAPDDRGHREELPPALAQAREPRAHHLPHALGQGQRAGDVGGHALLEGVDRLDGHERVAGARRPDALREIVHGGRGADPRDGLDQRGRLAPRQRRQRDARDVTVTLEIEEQPQLQRRHGLRVIARLDEVLTPEPCCPTLRARGGEHAQSP
jgi:hypothetical protein